MAITAERTYETVAPVVRLEGVLGDDATYYKGQLVVIDAGKFASPTNAANKVPAGVLTGYGFDPTGGGALAVADGATVKGEVVRGKVWVPFTGAAQTDVGLLFYLVDNGDVSKTAGAKTWAVLCVGFKTGHVLLDFDNLQGAAA